MQDQGTNGSVGAGAAGQAGNPAATTLSTGGEGSNPGGGAAWWSGLQDEGNRTLAQTKGWQAPDDAIRSYKELEGAYGKLAGEALKVPGADASPEQIDAFHRRLGRPDAPDGYQFTMPEGAPDNLRYEQKDADRLRQVAHKAGLNPQQAQSLHDAMVTSYAETVQAQAAQVVKAEADATKALEQAWGAPDSTGFQRNAQLADRAIRQLGGTDLKAALMRTGALGPAGEVREPAIAVMLAKVGAQLFTEDTLYAGPSSVENPWAGKSFNLTKQGEILRRDPNHARTLIEMAGLKPETYGIR